MEKIDFYTLLRIVQEYISKNYSAALYDESKKGQIKKYIEKFLTDTAYTVKEYEGEELVGMLYREMAEYSILTPYLGREDVEEININSWEDITVTFTSGETVKLDETFFNPSHALDIVKRLLRHSGMIIDNATPLSQGHLPGNTRITALKEPLVDGERGVSASIRLLHPSKVKLEDIVKSGGATEEMTGFLSLCLRYGVSFVVAGATSSGKTTLLNALLETVDNKKRVFSIESGSRELALEKREGGKIINNTVSTLSRPSDNNKYNITQEDLVVCSLRFNPDIVVVGEMRDVEAYSAVEASLTGHTVLSTIHASGAALAHTRLALLCQKRFPIDFSTTLSQVSQAFPLVVYMHRQEDNTRRVTDISECVCTPTGEREYRTLYKFKTTKNTIGEDGKVICLGRFEKVKNMSDELVSKLTQAGAPSDEIKKYIKVRKRSTEGGMVDDINTDNLLIAD